MENLKKCIAAFYLLTVLSTNAFSQSLDSHYESKPSVIYPFILQDSPARLFTMRQFDQDYLSGYRLLSPLLSENFGRTLNYIIKSASHILVFSTLTHEEAHRSVLLTKNIGSISQPFFLSKRGGYIEGVSDQVLKNLRDTDFPTYAHLYTAGLESNYVLNYREESLLSFGDETYKNINVEYILRKFALIQYYLIGFVHYNIDGTEEKDESKRDIVGNDVYGIARHWHRPTMEFKRYTLYDELTIEEKNYVHKMGFRSLLNLISPNLYGISNFKISNNLTFNSGLGYTMSPFGDFIDENIWLNYKNILKVNIYLREFQNKYNWFPAAGFGITDFMFTKNISADFEAHIWDQPRKLSFTDTIGSLGGAFNADLKYFFLVKHEKELKGVSLDIGVMCKTSGFLPEEIMLKKYIGVRLGVSFAFGKQ